LIRRFHRVKLLEYIMFLHRLTFYKKRPFYGLNFGNMKHLLIILFILFGFSGFGQNRFPSVDSAKNYVLRYIKNSAVESFTNWRMQNVTYGTLELLDSLASQSTDTTSLSNRIDLRVKYSDTAAMLSPYLRSNVAAATYQPIGNYDTATVVKAYVTNAEAVTITKGQVVYIFGASGDRAAVKLAKNTSDTFSSKTLGIVRADIAAGQAGWVTTQGQVSGINLGAYSPGDILWLDSVPGGFTKVKPVAPLHGVFVGVVERANVGNGLIYVKPQNGQELGELHDVKITSPKSGDAITYTSSSDIWENRQVVLKQDTIPLAVFNVGSAAAGDTTAFSTSTLAGSFYLDGTDTMFVTSYRVALQGTSASITPDVWFNDSLNVTAGGTKLVNSPSAITNLTTGTSVTPNTNKVPPGNFVFVRFSAVTTKPTYFTLTLFGYRIRKQ